MTPEEQRVKEAASLLKHLSAEFRIKNRSNPAAGIEESKRAGAALRDMSVGVRNIEDAYADRDGAGMLTAGTIWRFPDVASSLQAINLRQLPMLLVSQFSYGTLPARSYILIQRYRFRPYRYGAFLVNRRERD